ncbi:coil containing protein [Vibrio phage 237E40-1]|nr:coil containing protein [Vibrio phage 237E40-1]
MPLIPLNETPIFSAERNLETEAEKETRLLGSYTAGRIDADGGAWETVKAAFRMDNSAVSYAYNKQVQTFDELEGYNPYVDEEETKGYDPMMFTESRSPEQTAYIKSQVDMENEDRRFVESQGMGGWAASMAAGLTDPMTMATMLIPFGAVVKGGSVAMTAAKAAAGGVVGSGATEYALHQSQMTRTAEESAMNILADTVLSGTLGAAVQVFKNKGEIVAATQPLKDYMTDQGAHKSVGAAAVKQTTMADETLLYAKAVKAAGFFSPQVAMMQSNSLAARKAAQSLAENNLIFAKNEAGIATKQSVETNIKRYNGLIYTVNRDLKTMYAAYKKRVGQDIAAGNEPADLLAMTPIDDRLSASKGRKTKPISEQEFYEQVTKAMRNGDEHMTPEIQAAAKQLRPIYDETGRKSVELGLLAEEALNVKTAKSYVNRAYNFGKITKQRPDFVKILTNHFRQADQQQWIKSQEDMDVLRAMGVTDDEIMLNHSELLGDRLSDMELEEIANGVTDKILGAPNGLVDEYQLMPEGLIGKAGVLKERTLNIPDNDIAEFLENDITFVMNRYIRQIAPDIELTKAFGSKDLKIPIDDINREYGELKIGKSAKEADDLEKARKKDIKNLELMRDRLLGTYGQPADPTTFAFRASRAVRQINFLSMLGGMAISAIPDMSRTVMQHGLKNSAEGLIKFSRISTAALRSDAAGKAAKEELKEMGVAIDYVLSTRAQAFADITADNMQLSKFERGMEKGSNMFGNFTLMNQWNDVMKMWGGLIIQSRVMKAAQTVGAGGKLSKGQLQAMTRTGLDEETLGMIAEQFKKHGEKDGGLFLARSDKWDNEMFADGTTLTERYQSAVLGDVENVIVTPSVGDKPAWFDGNEAQKHIMQFKSFFLATSSKMAGNMQQNNASFYSGVVMAVGLGALTSNIKEMLRGKEPDYSWNNQLKEGLDYSGVMGWAAEPLALADKWSGGSVGMGVLLGVDSQTTRYQSRGNVGAMLGASVSTGENMINIVNGIMGEEWKANHTRSVRKLIPAQNLFYLRTVLNEAEQGINEMAGIK